MIASRLLAVARPSWLPLLGVLLACRSEPVEPPTRPGERPPAKVAEVVDTTPRYELDAGCQECAELRDGGCLSAIETGAPLGCGWISDDRRYAVSFAIVETPTDDLDSFPDGVLFDHRYTWWGSAGRSTGEWSICLDYGAGCELKVQFLVGGPLALTNYGETGAGGSTNSLLDLDRGEHRKLEAMGALRPEPSPDGTRLAYHDLTDYGRVEYADGGERLEGSVFCLDLATRQEHRIGSWKQLTDRVGVDDGAELRWLDDTRVEVEITRDDATVGRGTFRCPPVGG